MQHKKVRGRSYYLNRHSFVISLIIYSRVMKTQHQNVYQYLKDILDLLSQRISCDFVNTNGMYHIDFISFNVKYPIVNIHAHNPTVVE